MSPRGYKWLSGACVLMLMVAMAPAQVLVVGEKSATANLKTDFHPTNIPLPQTKLTERGRRALIRAFEAEQGFAHRELPLGATLTLHANGDLTPGGDEYKSLIYKKGSTAGVGDRVAISKLDIKGDRIVFDLNGGPYLPHRFLRHIDLGDTPLTRSTTDTASGSRLTLVFDKFVPEISADQVKALIDQVIDFNAKTGEKTYAETLPPKLHDAIVAHQVLVGMDQRMVAAALGQPENKVRESTGDSGAHYEEWIYGQPPQTVRFVRFIGDRVTMIKIAALGQPIEIRDKDETDGYLPAIPTRVIAMGDAPAGEGDHAAPPTLRMPGEAEPPGTLKKVEFPTDSQKPVDSNPTPNSEKPPAAQPQQ